jgi:hypothetical protein
MIKYVAWTGLRDFGLWYVSGWKSGLNSSTTIPLLVEQVMKWGRGNYLWVVVLLEPSTKSSTLTDHYLLNGVPTKIKDLIYDFDALFQEPYALPPSRTYDHSIILLPNAAPVADHIGILLSKKKR